MPPTLGGKALGGGKKSAGTHEHYAGEFGSVKKPKKELMKDPAYRAERAAHYAMVAKKAALAHGTANGSERAKHALLAAHGAKKAAGHAKAAKKLSDGSPAHGAHVMAAEGYAHEAAASHASTKSTHTDTHGPAASHFTTSGHVGEAPAIPHSTKPPKTTKGTVEHSAARAAHYAKIAQNAAIMHKHAIKESDKAKHALVIENAIKKTQKYTKAANKQNSGSTHAQAAHQSNEAALRAKKSINGSHQNPAPSAPTVSQIPSQPAAGTGGQLTADHHAMTAKEYAKAATTAAVSHYWATDATAKAIFAATVQTAAEGAAKHAALAKALIPDGAAATVATFHAKLAKRAVEKISQNVAPAASTTHTNPSQPTQTGAQPVIGKQLTDSEFHSFKTAFKDKLASDEKKAALTYSGSSYSSINTSLRKGHDLGVHEKTVKNLDSMMEKAVVPIDILLHRGAGGSNSLAHYSAMQVGDSYIEKGYSSTSAFNHSAFGGSVSMKITVPAGGKAAPIPSHHDNEKEYLLPRNQKFTIHKIEKIDNNYGGMLVLHVHAIQE